MNKIDDIRERLKLFRERTNIKMPAIALVTGIAKETLYKWEKGTKPSDINDYFTLKTYLDEMENKLAEEQLKLDIQKPATLWLPLNRNLTPIPQTDNKAAAGTITILNGELGLIVDRINAPLLGSIDGVIEVTGESMAPTFINGCRIGVLRMDHYRTLNWGAYYYFIDKNWRGLVRRVYQGETANSLLLVSDNPDQALFPPMVRRWEQIEAVLNIVVTIIKQ